MKSIAFNKGNALDTSQAVFNIITSLIHELLELGCSLSEIAQHTQISMRTLGRLHRGEIAQPTQRTFSRVLSFYCHRTTHGIKNLIQGE